MDPAQALIYALKERNITPKRDEITAAFQDESDSAQNAEWVRKHLTPDTLLSAEEVILYSKLERSSTLTGILADTDIDSTRPFLDGDLQKAIEALNTSTAEIQRQTDILTSQYDILRRQLKRDEDREARRNRQSERLRQKHDAGRQNVAAASSELALEFETSLKNESEKSMMDGKKTLSALTARIKEDDKILSDLERLAAGVNSSVDDASVMRRTSDLSNALAQYVSEEIYCRLDRLYLEAVLGSSKTVSHVSNDAATKAVVSLEEELDSLYPEVDILAEMSTKQQFVEPILRELQNHHGQLRIVSHQKLDYILGTVTDMTTSTERLIASLERRESFCATLEALASAFRSEAGDQVLGSTRSRRETMRRFSTQPTPTTTQPAKKPCSFHESESLSGIFRRVGISSESVFHSEEAGNAADTLTQERQRMLDGLRNYGVASDSPLPVELLSTDRAIRLLSSSLEADSPFAASLSSVEHEESLSELESKLGRIQKGIQGLNQDVIYQRDKNQENFLRKWG